MLLRLVAIYAVVAVSACSAGAGGSAVTPAAQTAVAFDNVYVANRGGVAVYQPGQTVPSRTIHDGVPHPQSLAVDRLGYLYVANSCLGRHCSSRADNSVAVFAPGQSSPARVISGGVQNPTELLFDTAGNLYVGGDDIAVYAPGSTSPSRRVQELADAGMALGADGTLYVGTFGAAIFWFPCCQVTVFAATGSKLQTITDGVGSPSAVAVDGYGNLFVAHLSGGVTEYPPGKKRPLPNVFQTPAGSTTPAIALDAAGNLYVTNYCTTLVCKAKHDDAVAVYAPGTSTPLRTITAGLNQPHALAFDAAGNLYVSNANSVTEYAAGTSRLLRTIVAGIDHPGSLAFGP